VDQAWLVREGDPTAQTIPRKAFTLGSALSKNIMSMQSSREPVPK
jgi:hypothetical protein